MSESPAWVDCINSNLEARRGLSEHLAIRIAMLLHHIGRDAKDFEAVQLARGAINELESLQQLLTRREKEDAGRQRYDSKCSTSS